VSGLLSRLDRLEAKRRVADGVTSEERERERKLIRESAEHANHCFPRDRYFVMYGYKLRTLQEALDLEELFYIDDDGNVYSNVDGKPITQYRQLAGEEWYWDHLLCWPPDPRFTHDEEDQAFYTHHGELALSRDMVDLRLFLGDPCRCDACLAQREERGG
jgi:hypothetical protein